MSKPHPIWTAAGPNPVSVTKATVVSWLLLNVYKTGERLHKFKKSKTPECVSCLAPVDSQIHFALQCPSLSEIRSQFMKKFFEACPELKQIHSNPQLFILALLDPFSPLLPEDIRDSWRDSDEAYELSRNYFYNLHKKREKINESKSGEHSRSEDEDVTKIIISVYENI